jgi:hypothetical protein
VLHIQKNYSLIFKNSIDFLVKIQQWIDQCLSHFEKAERLGIVLTDKFEWKHDIDS